jgi:Ala-tRNA(Pro) deacylase
MAVLPVAYKVNFNRLKEAVGAKEVKLATEREFEGMFPDCELGAMPPFGNLYGVDVFVDESLTADKDIAFNACRHSELIRLSYRDFEELVNPRVMKFTR